jgi:2-polyprenyl-6-methoxyphenol hydroxylase-like FAD-dependent oxidoreductase
MSSISNPSKRYDVIVVGARASGAATAMLLARHGLEVLALDRGRYATDTLSTNALMRAGVLQLHRWGLVDRLREAGTPPVRAAEFHYGGDTLRVPIKPADGVDALFAPRRSVLDRILVDAAREAGVDMQFGVSVDGLQRDANGRVIGIVGRDERGKPITPRAAVTVGADGVKSRVAREVEAEVTRTGTDTGAVVFGYFRNTGVEDAYIWSYDEKVSAGFIPTNDDAVCVFTGSHQLRFKQEIQRDIAAGFYAVLGEAAPAFADRIQKENQVEHFRGFPGIIGYYRRPWGDGWALVGDAGYFKDPITAHGISDALRDAELLARALTKALDDPSKEEQALAEYERIRDEVSHDLFDVTEQIAAYAWTLDDLRVILGQLSKSMGPEVELIKTFGPPS